MKVTGGQGVDVVLNSLAGLHQRLGLQALRSSGRFCEIGKVSGRGQRRRAGKGQHRRRGRAYGCAVHGVQVDIFANSSVGLLAFRKNLSFFAVDMDRLALDDPEASKQVGRQGGGR